jgi:hypothetical protein
VPRIRTIKPEFFQHEGLFEAEVETGLPLRIVFVGLWTIADKAGRFEWRPRQIKLNVLPYDTVDFAAVLSALETCGFIRRYAVEAKIYGCIPSWERHQYRNGREPDSTIPPPPEGSGSAPPPDQRVTGVTSPAPDSHQPDTSPSPDESSRKGREGKGGGKEDDALVRALATPGLDEAAFRRWVDYRASIRKGLKAQSIEAAAHDMAAMGAAQAAAVQHSISNGYTGLFAPKSGATNGPREAPLSAVDRVRQATGVDLRRLTGAGHD